MIQVEAKITIIGKMVIIVGIFYCFIIFQYHYVNIVIIIIVAIYQLCVLID